MRERNERRKGRGGRFLRRILAIVMLALAIILADVLSPYVKKWASALLPKLDYQSTAVQLTHEMEKAGELIAVRHTETGVMTGTIEAVFIGTVSKVSAPYLYEIGLGIKLADVVLSPEEDSLTVIVPPAQVLYDNFQITDDPQTDDFWGFATQSRYQKMQDEQQAACRQAYVDDPQYMTEAWEVVCEQLETLFRQWTGENLTLRFLREGE